MAEGVHFVQDGQDEAHLIDVKLLVWQLSEDLGECAPYLFKEWQTFRSLYRIIKPEEQGVDQCVEF